MEIYSITTTTTTKTIYETTVTISVDFTSTPIAARENSGITSSRLFGRVNH